MSRKKKSRDRQGICKLTHEAGTFVDSHLLPKALTKAEGLGPGLTQIGNGQRKKRKSSWYDPALVTGEGEEILARYDDQAISTLRRQALVWSGWGPRQELAEGRGLGGGPGIRKLVGEDWKQLRLFFLSILWRAAATNLEDFEEVKIPEDELETLRG